LRAVRGEQRWLLVAGAALGLALETKYNGVFFAIALVVALALVPERRLLATRAFAGGAALCIAIALPSALWQAAHGFPIIELLRNGQQGKNLAVGPLVYFGQEVVITGLLFTPVWLVGLVRLAGERNTRFLALTWVLLMAIMLVLHGKHYYPAPVYPIPFAAGAVQLERWTSRMRLLRPVLAAALLAAGAAFIPFALPVLSEQRYLSYEAQVGQALHITRRAIATEHHATSVLPPDFADMHGWPELAATVDGVVATLTPRERTDALIVASNYGEAAAIEFFGRDLLPVASGHNQYFLWGTHGRSGNVVIDVNGDCGARDHLFADVRRAAVAGTPYAISYEQDLPVMVCRRLRFPIGQIWPRLKHYI